MWRSYNSPSRSIAWVKCTIDWAATPESKLLLPPPPPPPPLLPLLLLPLSDGRSAELHSSAVAAAAGICLSVVEGSSPGLARFSTVGGMPQQLQTAREIFDVLDVDGGGSISAEEMGIGLQKLGHDCTQVELHALVAKLDTDGSGTLEFEEFVAAAQHFLHREESQYTRHVADLQYLGDERPPVVRQLRPAERQALVDQEWARIRKERMEMASWRDDMTVPEPEPEPRELTDAQREELQRHPVERGVVAHERNTEKLSEYREAAHAKALAYQVQGTAHMKARRYSEAALCFKQALTEGPTSVAYKDFLDSWKVAELERDLARAEEMAAMKDRAHLMGHMSAAELAMRDKMDKSEAEERELMQHHFASDYKAAAPPTSLAAWGGTSAPSVGPGRPAEEFLQVTDDFEKHFNAEAAALEREEAHKLAKQALENYTEMMKAAKYTHAASVMQSALQRELDTRRLVDWLDPWRILEMEQAVKIALQMDKTVQEEQRQAVCISAIHMYAFCSISNATGVAVSVDEQAALAERTRIRRAEEAEEARKAARVAAERMRLRKQKMLRLEDPQGQYSAAVQYLNRERFKDKPEPPPPDDNALAVLTRRHDHQGMGVQYHVRYKGHVQWLSTDALSAAAAEEGGVNASMRVLALAKEAMTEIEVRLGEADLAADAADERLAEANDRLHALAGQRDLGEAGRQLAVAQRAAADNRDRVHAAAVAIALEMRGHQSKIDDAETALEAAKGLATELFLRWQSEGERKEQEQNSANSEVQQEAFSEDG